MIDRISKPWMFMEMADAASNRSTCRRNKVGVVITDLAGTSVVSIGYNGNARGLPNDCDRDTPGDCGCIHAEVNALIKAPFHQGPLVLYSTLSPCPDCAKLIINSAVRHVVYRDMYRDSTGIYYLTVGHITTVQLTDANKLEQLELAPGR